MSHIFISYSKQNIEFARHLRGLLQDEGFSVWMDETRLEPSNKWWPSIEENIKSCAAFIVIMSPQSQESTWVEREILVAEKVDKSVFPVLFSGEAWSRLADLQYEDMTQGLESQLSIRFVRGLEAVVSRTSADTLPLQLPGESMLSDVDTLPLSEANRVSMPSSSVAQFLGRPWWQGVSVIVAIIALIVAILALPPFQQQNATPTPDATATYATTQTAVAMAALSATPTETESPTPTSIPPSVTSEPPTMTPDTSTLAVEIFPLTVQPGGQVVVRTEPGANCLFQPTQGRDFGFDTSSGRITFDAPNTAGVSVKVTCTFNGQRSEPQTFTVAAPTPVPSNTPTSIPPTSTPTQRAATATPTPTAVAGDSVTLMLFRDEDSLTLYVPPSDDPLSLEGLKYRVTLLGGGTISRRLDQDYAAFLGMPFANIGSLGQGLCFRLLRSGGTRPVPQVCQSGVLLLTQQVASADVFWRDGGAAVDRTIFIYRDDRLVAACGPEAQCAVEWPVGSAVASAFTATPGYPCDGMIVFSGGGLLNQVRITPQMNAPFRPAVQQASTVNIFDRRSNDGKVWYQMEYENGANQGWIPIEYVNASELCPD